MYPLSRQLVCAFGLAATLVLPSAGMAAPAKSSPPVGNPKSLELNEQAAAAAKAGRFQQAEDLFRQALNIDPTNVTAAFNLSGMYLRNKKEAAAIALLNDYIKKAPQDPGLYARLGDVHFASKNISLARVNYEKAFEIEPGHPNVTERLGTIYTMEKRLGDAEKMFFQAAEQKPNDAKLLGSLSSIYLANNKPQRAVSTAKRSLQIRPSSEVYVTLGNAYELLKDFPNSMIAFQRARDLGDSSEELEDKIEQLEEITKARS